MGQEQVYRVAAIMSDEQRTNYARRGRLSVSLTACAYVSLATTGSCAAGAQDQPENTMMHPAHTEATHDDSANAFMHRRAFADLIAGFESPKRMEWQRPDVLLDLLEPLAGKTVADIGSGSGFLALRMVERGASKVLCVDIDERFLAYILGKRDGLGLGAAIETRLSPADRPALAEGEIDLAVTVNTYHHIEDRVAYFQVVRSALRNGGRLVVVDFRSGDLPVGPPASMKIDISTIENELRAAGFEGISVDTESLPYQFVLTADRD